MVEKIEQDGTTYAIILRRDKPIDGVEFYTPQTYPFQFGAQKRKAGTEISPHIHKKIERTINASHEMLHIDDGKVEVDIFDNDKNKLATVTLEGGDTILTVDGGHGFRIIEDAKLIEIKQGPYKGAEADKENF